MNQKRDPAPMERMQNRAIGLMRRLLVRSLQTMMLMPKMAYAMKHARCPVVFSFISSLSLFRNLTFPLFLEIVCLVEADQSFAVRYATAFSIYQDVGHGGALASEVLAHDFLFFVVVQTVESDDAQG